MDTQLTLRLYLQWEKINVKVNKKRPYILSLNENE